MAARRFFHVESGKFLGLMLTYDRHYSNVCNPLAPIAPAESNKYNSNFAYNYHEENLGNTGPELRTTIANAIWSMQDTQLFFTPYNFGNYTGGGKCMEIAAMPREYGTETTQNQFYTKEYGEYKGQKAIQIWFDYLNPDERKVYKFAVILHKVNSIRYQVGSVDNINDSNVADTLFYTEPGSKD